LRRIGQQRLHHLPAACIRHVHDIDAGAQLEEFDREVALGADPPRRIIQWRCEAGEEWGGRRRGLRLVRAAAFAFFPDPEHLVREVGVIRLEDHVP
jgi:hypothetical protein